MIIQRSQKEVKISAGSLFILSMDLFMAVYSITPIQYNLYILVSHNLQVLRASGSFITLLQSMQD